MAFYKYQDEALLDAPNFVSAPDYELVAEQHQTYTFPVDGWYWFDTIQQAWEFFGIEPDPQLLAFLNPQE